jgi:hypothetical protein
MQLKLQSIDVPMAALQFQIDFRTDLFFLIGKKSDKGLKYLQGWHYIKKTTIAF